MVSAKSTLLAAIASLRAVVTALATDMGSNVETAVRSTENGLRVEVISDIPAAIGFETGTTALSLLNTTAHAIGLESRQAATCKVCVVNFFEAGGPGNSEEPCQDGDRPAFSRCVGNSVGCVNVNTPGGPLPHGFNSARVGVCTCTILLYNFGCSSPASSKINPLPNTIPGNLCYTNFIGGTGYGYSIQC